MSDLFHENIPDLWIDRIFAVMALCPQHTFQVLTKRAERMQSYCARPDLAAATYDRADRLACKLNLTEFHPADSYLRAGPLGAPWPLPNVWLGVSVEDQERADERIRILVDTPAEVRFLSCEPLLGPIDLRAINGKSLGWGVFIDWVIAGGESGPGARPMHPQWARFLRNQCVEAKVPFFFKQWGEWALRDASNGDIPFTRCKVYLGDDASVVTIARVGKKRAGRTLDGRTWDEFPASSQSPGATTCA